MSTQPLFGTTHKKAETANICQRKVTPITVAVGMTLRDQSNLATLNQMEPELICLGILNINNLNELYGLKELIQKTRHHGDRQIVQALLAMSKELE
ncbi:MAG: hypothetical protein MI784_11065, partial [Cytophagales bacterium]|nr:hypothetical protein [Cytophagales bacterium]